MSGAKSKFFSASALALLLSVGLFAGLSGCSGHSAFENSMSISQDAKLKMFKEPTQGLTPTTTESPEINYAVYNLVSAKFGADNSAHSVSAQVKVVSTAGTELVDLVGALRPDGTASLVDLRPLSDSKNRLVAEALCADVGTCKQMILNVYYNVAGKTLKKQFSSESLRAPEAAPEKAPQTAPKLAPHSNSTAASGEALAADSSDLEGEDELHPTEKNLPNQIDESDEKLGDFVGAPRNEVLIGQLWSRSLTPELPPVVSGAGLSKAALPTTPASPSAKPIGKKTTTPESPQRKAETKVQTPETETAAQRWMRRFKNWMTPPVAQPVAKPKAIQPVSPKPAANPVAKLAPAAPVPVKLPIPAAVPAADPAHVPAPSKPTVPPVPPLLPAPDQSLPKPKPVPAAPPGPVREQKPAPVPTQPSTETSNYPFPPAQPLSTGLKLDQKMTLLEAHLAPLMNLRDGGVSKGGYADSTGGGIKSAIVNSSILPSNLESLVPVTVTQSAHYGSGMLVSFLENAASYLFEQLGLKLFVGDMSLKNGGSYGRSSSHHTHRNGLDADVAWIGIAHPLRDSALSTKGDVVEGFDYKKTWDFLRLAAKQEIVEDAQKSTAVSRVFMSPAVKVGFCSWAKQNNLFDDPLNAELMRLVRPVAGHYKHFHLSLKCSPHYPLCRNLAGPPPPGTGCR
jgi:penicillin-insensitive murein endopeptidase